MRQMKVIEANLVQTEVKLKTPNGDVKFTFAAIKQNELGKLLIDLENAKNESLDPLKSKEVLNQYNLLPFKKLRKLEGDLFDDGEKVTLETLQNLDLEDAKITTQLFRIITKLFWDNHRALNGEEVDEKKDNKAGDLPAD